MQNKYIIKSEIRISKSETNSKFKCSNFQNLVFWSFEFWSLDIVSNFVIRYSNFVSERFLFFSFKFLA